VIVWEYEVRPEQVAAFEALYGPDGDWTRLFGKGDGYVETLLFRDTGRPTRYLTIDRWRSRAAYEAFVSSSRSLYAALDRRGDALTVSERRVGTFCDAMAWEP
jgi:heme-degrading monooxygenase HmoA